MLDHVWCCLVVSIGMNHFQQFWFSPLFFYEIADTTCLKVGHDNLRWILRIDETSIQFEYGEQFLIANSDNYLRCEAVSPFRRVLSFLMHCHAFRKPARNTVLRRIKY